MRAAQPTTPRDPRLKEGWRLAAAAYRKALGENYNPHRGCAQECYNAAEVAMKSVLPDLTNREIMLESVAAVSFESQMHPDWLYALCRSAPRNE